MIVACVRIHGAASFVADSHLHLVCVALDVNIAREDRTIVGNDDIRLVSVQHMHGDPIEMPAILLKDKELCSFLSHRIDGQNNLIVPLFDGN